MQKRGKALRLVLRAQSLELREPSGRETAGKPAEQQKKRKSGKGPEARKGGPGPEDEGQRGDERAEALSTKTATRRMKAGRTGAEAQRRRQNGSARGERKKEKKRERGREPGRGTSDYVLSTVLWAEKREEEGKKERKRRERAEKRERRRR